ncbi:MAG: ARMT1-like domain-containing protein [bacterium]
MDISLDCIPCIVEGYTRLLKAGMLPEEVREPGMRRLLDYLARVDYRQSPPVLGRELHRMIREDLDDPDPYRHIKAKANRMMLDRYPELQDLVEASDDPFDTAMRLAVAGNAIDFAPRHQLDVMETIDRVLGTPLAIDHSEQLREELASAATLLYVGDNAGEIVLDRLFLQQIAPPERYFAVRGGPVINDAILEDARTVGMEGTAGVITTGDDAPGAVLEGASEEFREAFETSEVVIAKGQGNLEALLDSDRDVYFLLITKCELIARRVGVERGDFVVGKALGR